MFAAAARLHQAGHWGEAAERYRDLLAFDPLHAPALHASGVLAYQAGRHADAGDLIARAIARDGAVADYHVNLGNVFQAQQKWDEAAACYGRALALEPGGAGPHFNLGVIWQAQGKWSEAASSYRQALAFDPRHAEAHGNLGNVLQALGRTGEALECYRQALLIKPGFAAAHYNLGVAFEALGELDLAAGAYEETLALQPGALEARYNLGVVFQAQGKLDQAIAAYRAVLSQKPGFAEAHYNLGVALQAQGLLDDAMASYRRAWAEQPSYAKALSNILLLQHYRDEVSQAEMLAMARRFGALFGAPAAPAGPRDRRHDRRLRIGYVSGDLHFHPVGYFLSQVLASHDVARVEVFCYANSAAPDAMTARLRGASHHWREIGGLPDDAVAALICADNIDILVDLAGHTGRNRLTVFALRPAPVQVSWIGYPGTIGLDTIDYMLMDIASVPPGDERWFHEAVVRLQHGRFCYQPPGNAPVPAAPPSLRQGFVTFGSFNNIAKISPSVVRLWSHVLDAVPRSRLLLKWGSLGEDVPRRRLIEAFEAAGVSPERIELRGRSPHAEMLGEYAGVDIALDPFPFGGGLTSCEALWMGVPVLTLPGARPASRQTLGFLHSLGLEEWAAASPADYVEKAKRFAADADNLAKLRVSLRSRMASSPLCDGPRFTAALEAAFREMWRRACDGERPGPFPA